MNFHRFAIIKIYRVVFIVIFLLNLEKNPLTIESSQFNWNRFVVLGAASDAAVKINFFRCVLAISLCTVRCAISLFAKSIWVESIWLGIEKRIFFSSFLGSRSSNNWKWSVKCDDVTVLLFAHLIVNNSIKINSLTMVCTLLLLLRNFHRTKRTRYQIVVHLREWVTCASLVYKMWGEREREKLLLGFQCRVNDAEQFLV